MSIRRATQDDLEEILNLFTDTIQRVNAADYSEDQIRVWSNAKNKEAWSQKIKDQYFLVKETEGRIVGFSSIDDTGYLDFMYVHADFLRLGIATDLLHSLLKKACSQGSLRVWSSVSQTAQPFFSKHGFQETRQEQKSVQGIAFTNAIMEKELQQLTPTNHAI